MTNDADNAPTGIRLTMSGAWLVAEHASKVAGGTRVRRGDYQSSALSSDDR